jgi:protein arginine kinase activator
MKCQKCNKSATFHITDLTGDGLLALHLCPDCAKHYLQPDEEDAPKITGVLSDQLKLEQTAEDLKELDSKKCPICGISFYEFRQAGRLGCPHDYVFFGDELKPLLESVHGAPKHTGKQPQRGAYDTESQTELIRLRGEMKSAVLEENYERAQEIRDRIRSIESQP